MGAGTAARATIRIGTRGSALALAQSEGVARAIRSFDRDREVELVPIVTAGDQAAPTGAQRGAGSTADKSRFTAAIELALLRGEVDLAVHSAKDVPGELPEGLALVGAPKAEDPRDALVGARSLEALPDRARVGTSSLRRRSQLLALRPDLDLVELRGNVDTRLTKLAGGACQAIMLAFAGLRRLGREREAGAVIDPAQLVPAPGQGVLALEARADDETTAALARDLSDQAALVRLGAERAFVRALGAGCDTPVGALAEPREGELELQAYVGLPDGREWVRDRVTGAAEEPERLGEQLAARMLAAGAGEMLRALEVEQRA